MDEISPKTIQESIKAGTGFAIGRLFELHNEAVQTINALQSNNRSLRDQIERFEKTLKKASK